MLAPSPLVLLAGGAFIQVSVQAAFLPPTVTIEPSAAVHAIAARQTTTAPIATSTVASTHDIYFLTTEWLTVGYPASTIPLVLTTCLPTITPDANGYVPPGTCNAIWDYYPSFGAAVFFAAVFFVLTVAHIWQAAWYKKRFCWVIIMAAIWETTAFASRAVSARMQQSVGIYLIFQIFILLSPLWVNAFDYMVLGRMIYYFTPDRSLFGIPASTIAASFVALDFVSFVIQLVGGSLAGPNSPPEDQLRAIHIYMGGIGLQEFFIVVFLGLAVKFWLEMRKVDKGLVIGPLRQTMWRPLLFTLFGSLLFISVRIIFRLIEFSAGSNEDTNPIISHEAYFYVLEATPMVLAIVSFNIVHPGAVLVGPDAEMPGLWRTIKSCCCGSRRAKEFKSLEEDGSGYKMSLRS